MTIREFISSVRHDLNNVSSDDYISGEKIYWTGISIAKLYIKRESNSRKLFRNFGSFVSPPICIEMESYTEGCIDLGCLNMVKSKIKLSEVFLTSYGSLLRVFNATREVKYDEISIDRYNSLRKLKTQSKFKKYFWIEDGYLVIPDSMVETVYVSGLFTDPTWNSTKCSILDNLFPCIGYMETSVIEGTVKELSISKQIPKDENTNVNSNLK